MPQKTRKLVVKPYLCGRNCIETARLRGGGVFLDPSAVLLTHPPKHTRMFGSKDAAPKPPGTLTRRLL